MFQRADLVFCVSESSRADLEEFYGIRQERTRVVYNGVSEMKRTQKGQDELRKIVDQDFILYVGKRDGYKNFAGLVKAIQLSGVYHTHRLVSFGGGLLTSQEKGLSKMQAWRELSRLFLTRHSTCLQKVMRLLLF